MKVLLVGNHGSQVDALADALRRADYHVAVAKDFDQAMSLIRENHCDAAIIDVLVPEVNGIQIYRAPKKTSPEARAIFISGYMKTDELDDLAASEKIAFVTKPFRSDAVLDFLNRWKERGQQQAGGLKKEPTEKP